MEKLSKKNNRLILNILYPKLFSLLNTQDLNEIEIDYICLYILGLNGKEISELLGSSGHYNLSSTIRKKLGLTSTDTNLSLFIKNILQDEKKNCMTPDELYNNDESMF